MAFEKSNKKMCKLMAKVEWIFADINSSVNPPLGKGKINDVMMIRRCHENDIMIEATLHWLLLAMWQANHLINSHVIGKSENHIIYRKNMRHVFMNEMEHFEHLNRFELRASDIKDGIHASLACITCPRLENITTNFLHFVSWITNDFNFLPELSKMYCCFEQGSVG